MQPLRACYVRVFNSLFVRPASRENFRVYQIPLVDSVKDFIRSLDDPALARQEAKILPLAPLVLDKIEERSPSLVQTRSKRARKK